MQGAAKNEKDLSDVWSYNLFKYLINLIKFNKIILFFSSWTHMLLFIFYLLFFHSVNCRLMKVVPINVLVLPVMQEMEINILANNTI